MKLHSTSNHGLTATFAQAVELGIAPDGGLFMPALIPTLSPSFFTHERPFQEIAFEAARLLLGDEIPAADLRSIVETSLTFPAPVRLLARDLGVLELFHGPTLAFKDFGARFMARTLAYLRRGSERETTVLVATSGDTGSAVAQGFHNVEGLKVVLLYPSGRVSRIQELQLTTAGGNVTALEIAGTFDDCQRMVKQAFADQGLTGRRKLTSANSINIARLLPQSFYYMEAFVHLPHHERPVVFSVPSGNLGNLTAGLIAWKMGLPVERFVAATNVNDVLPRYLATGRYAPATAVQTLSNAMDVGNPSNLARINDLFAGDVERMRRILFSVAHNDVDTRQAITELFGSHRYILDPHGAVGYLALRDYQRQHDGQTFGIVLETAHPAKFPEAYSDELRGQIEQPERLRALLRGAKRSVKMRANFSDLKDFLLTSQ